MIDLRLGDCLEIMREMDADSVDAVVTDPPYGIGRAGWDDAQEKCDLRTWVQSWLVVAPMALFTWRANGIWNIGQELAGICDIWRVMVWHKPFVLNGSRANYKWHWEPVVFVGRIGVKAPWKPYYVPDVVSVMPVNMKNNAESVGHNSQKPVTLLRHFIEPLSAQTILDPFMGSGTTGVACIKLNRNFIGIEINPDYFAIAKRRIEEAQAQLALGLAV